MAPLLVFIPPPPPPPMPSQFGEPPVASGVQRHASLLGLVVGDGLCSSSVRLLPLVPEKIHAEIRQNILELILPNLRPQDDQR